MKPLKINSTLVSILFLSLSFSIYAQEDFQSSSYFCTGKTLNTDPKQKSGLFVVFEYPANINWKPTHLRIINKSTIDTTFQILTDTNLVFLHDTNAYFSYRIAEYNIAQLENDNLELRIELLHNSDDIVLFDEFNRKILKKIIKESDSKLKKVSNGKNGTIIWSRINCSDKDKYFKKLAKNPYEAGWFKTWEGGHKRPILK
ncbi:MAG: hypothetical protein EAZ27_06725 [Cytophagales bacterium]|nr:MAG: hypothetical protein EAZ27_06725 [Cytophagales bacterium]